MAEPSTLGEARDRPPYSLASWNLGAWSWPKQPEVDLNEGTPAVTVYKQAPGVPAS